MQRASYGRARWLAVLLVLGMFAAACSGGDGTESPSDEPAASESTEEADAGTEPPAEGEEGASRLRVALGTFGSESFEPIVMSTASAFDILTPMYDSLLGITPEGEVGPGVAESWEIDDEGVTFKLFEGMKFHNGEDLTADDVRFSMLRWLDPALEAEALPIYTLLMEDPEQDIQVVDDYTLRIDTPNGVPERLLGTVSLQQQHEAYVLPQETIEEEGLEAFLANPVGSGPWQFSEHVPGDRIVYKNADVDHPVRPEPAFEELELVLVPEEATAVAQLSTGEIDIAPLSPESVGQVEEAGLTVNTVPAGIQVHLFFSGGWADEGPLTDIRVREALSLAIDREEIIETVLQGYGEATPGILPGEFFPGMAGLDVDDFEGPLYDPERAQQLLEEAGYADGFDLGVYGFDMSGAPYLASLGELFIGYWQRLGIRGEFKPTDLDTFFGFAENENLDERVIGTAAAFRRRRGFAVQQAANGYSNIETPGGALVGPPGDEIIPNLTERIAAVTSTGGEEGEQLGADFMHEVGELYLAPSLFYGDAIFAVGNRAASMTNVANSPNLGMVYETAVPAE